MNLLMDISKNGPTLDNGAFQNATKTSFIATQGDFKMQSWVVNKRFQMLPLSGMLFT